MQASRSFASALLVFAIPLFMLLPEVGLPALLWSLSLLALEFDRAAKAYAWVTWRWQQFHAWFGRRHASIKTLVVATLAVAFGLLGLIFLRPGKTSIKAKGLPVGLSERALT